MIATRTATRSCVVAYAAIFIAALMTAPLAQAQRPSLAEMQAQIDAITHPYDEPAAQVRTALDILPTFQEAVVSFYRATGSAPADRTVAGLSSLPTDTQTSFISAVSIANGTVTFTFGNDADLSIAGKYLTFTPYETSDFTVVWRCGSEPAPAAAQLLGTNHGIISAVYAAPNIPASAHPNPCILKSYSDSNTVIRAQVRQALEVLPPFQEAVTRYYHANGAAPADREAAGLTSPPVDTGTNYISSVNITNGTIVVTYGNDAHSLLQDLTLTFTPYETADMSVVWRCGNDPSPIGTNLLGTAGGVRVAAHAPPSLANYLHPRPCITSASGPDDNVIRAQVLEPFAIVETVKAAVAPAGVALGSPSQPRPPMNRSQAGMTNNATDTSGRYFTSVGIQNGTITVTYNNAETHPNYRGDTMTWTPYETPDGTIVWRCGNAPQPSGTMPMGWSDQTVVAAYSAPTMPSIYLPSDCRP